MLKLVAGMLRLIGSSFITFISLLIVLLASITGSTKLLKLACKIWLDAADELKYGYYLIESEYDKKIDELYEVISEAYNEL